MLARTMTVAASGLLVAASAAAQPEARTPVKKPEAKAARVPAARPRLPDSVQPSLKQDAERGVAGSDRLPPAPVPAHQVTDLARTLKGTYACSGALARLDGAVRPTEARMKVAPDLDGYWIAFDITEQ